MWRLKIEEEGKPDPVAKTHDGDENDQEHHNNRDVESMLEGQLLEDASEELADGLTNVPSGFQEELGHRHS